MNSPIKTVITNKTDRPYVITCIPRRRIVIEAGNACTIEGDMFSQCENSRSITTILEQVVNGHIHIHYVVDGAFEVVSEVSVMQMPDNTRIGVSSNKALLRELVVEPVSAKKQETDEPAKGEEAPMQVEDNKESSDDKKDDEDVKLEELTISETVIPVAEEAKEEPKQQIEEPKQEASKAPEKPAEKPKAPKKVQVK